VETSIREQGPGPGLPQEWLVDGCLSILFVIIILGGNLCQRTRPRPRSPTGRVGGWLSICPVYVIIILGGNLHQRTRPRPGPPTGRAARWLSICPVSYNNTGWKPPSENKAQARASHRKGCRWLSICPVCYNYTITILGGNLHQRTRPRPGPPTGRAARWLSICPVSYNYTGWKPPSENKAQARASHRKGWSMVVYLSCLCYNNTGWKPPSENQARARHRKGWSMVVYLSCLCYNNTGWNLHQRTRPGSPTGRVGPWLSICPIYIIIILGGNL
jgi:hypothetical protein